MASTCPNCGKKLHFWNIKAECSACGVSIPNFDWEARLEEDNRNAEKAFGVFNRTLSRMAYSMWGTKLRIARLVLTFLPVVGFILPWSNIKGTGSSFVLSILAFDGSKSLIDFFKAFFGDVGLFTTTMGMEGYGRSGDPWCDWLLSVLTQRFIYCDRILYGTDPLQEFQDQDDHCI